MFSKQVLVFSYFGFLVSCLPTVPTVTKCPKEDSECIKKSAQSLLRLIAAGNESLQLKPLDPLRINKIAHMSTNLQFSARYFIVTGLRDCIFENVTNNVAKSILNVEALCTLDGESEYEIKGKVQNLQLDAQGHLDVSFNNILIIINLHREDKKEGGKIYWDFPIWDSSYDVREKSKMNLSNLFKGTVKPSQEVRDRLGVSLTDLVSQLEPIIINAIVNDAVEVIKFYFNTAPIEELIIE